MYVVGSCPVGSPGQTADDQCEKVVLVNGVQDIGLHRFTATFVGHDELCESMLVIMPFVASSGERKPWLPRLSKVLRPDENG